MPRTLYRDQVERFYELESLQYSRNDIASLCDVSDGQIRIWRKDPPRPERYPERPPQGIGLPKMRPPRPHPAHVSRASTKRAVPPPVEHPVPESAQGGPVSPGPVEQNPEKSPSKRNSDPADTTGRPRSVAPIPGFVATEKNPPGGAAEKARQGALRPVTRGQLDKAVAKELRNQRAEILKEIKEAGFNPAVTWTTEVDHVAFDPIRALVQLAHVPDCPHNTILGILRTLVQLRKERARIAWEGVKLDDIPLEVRPRLAGLLAEWLEVAELPAEVQENEALREVYELTGVALPKPADAEAFMLRWESALEGMRTDAEALAAAPVEQEKLALQGAPAKAAEFRVRPATGGRTS